MPYTDPETRRSYDREYKRATRAGESPCLTLSQTLPVEFRLETARDILNLLAEQVAVVRGDREAGKLERARCIGYLAGVALKAVEVVNVAERLEALERTLRSRRESEHAGN